MLSWWVRVGGAAGAYAACPTDTLGLAGEAGIAVTLSVVRSSHPPPAPPPLLSGDDCPRGFLASRGPCGPPQPGRGTCRGRAVLPDRRPRGALPGASHALSCLRLWQGAAEAPDVRGGVSHPQVRSPSSCLPCVPVASSRGHADPAKLVAKLAACAVPGELESGSLGAGPA